MNQREMYEAMWPRPPEVNQQLGGKVLKLIMDEIDRTGEEYPYDQN